ncbi:hypothetical protein KR059_009074 [Drosophila kikkawai]|nr:hypothetical protein KR059_009074 [Drosophila kikkawai]
MKMNEEVIYTDQLLHHRCVSSQIEKTRDSWNRTASWYPEAQKQFYDRYAEIYAESLEKYGNDTYEYYARRNRLRDEYLVNTRAARAQNRRETEISMNHIKRCRASPTTNGEYGRIQPMRLFYCFP